MVSKPPKYTGFTDRPFEDIVLYVRVDRKKKGKVKRGK